MIGVLVAKTLDREIVDLGDVIELRKRPSGGLAVGLAVGLVAALVHAGAGLARRSASDAAAVGELLEIVAAVLAVLGFVALAAALALVVLPGARVYATLDRRSRQLRVGRRTVSLDEIEAFSLLSFGGSSTSVAAHLRTGAWLRLWTVLAAQASRAEAIAAFFNGALQAPASGVPVTLPATQADAQRFSGAILLVTGALWALAGFILYPGLSLLEGDGLAIPLWTLGLPALLAGLWQLRPGKREG